MKDLFCSDINIGDTAVIESVGGEGGLRQHLLDLGAIPGVPLKVIGKAPMGDPVEILIRGYTLSLRLDQASLIKVRLTEEVPEPAFTEIYQDSVHPGLGEEGKYHNHEDDGNALPKDAPMRFILAGQNNSGKTALFNQLTGESQHVGNFPGVTMESKEGLLKGTPNVRVVDLPGLYSLAPFTSDEKVASDFILGGEYEGIINVVDAGNIERNLYLSTQLMELGVPMVIALNMMDEVRGNGGWVRVNDMEKLLGVPVVPIAAAKNEGVKELMKHVLHVARYREAPARQNFCSEVEISRIQKEKGLDRDAAMAAVRYGFVQDICSKTVVKPRLSKEYIRSRKMDRILTGKWTGIPIFLVVMFCVLALSIQVIGTPLQELLAKGIGSLAAAAGTAMQASSVHPAVYSLVMNALFGGVGYILSFVPIIVLMFFFLSLLEDSGYMSRVAYMTDKPLRKLGLSGRSIVPLLLGLGCSVPAVMASRTLPSSHDRKMTILLTPFMSCSAKIPIYAFFSAVFFPGYAALVFVALYSLSIFTGIVISFVGRKLSIVSQPVPFILELPNYRLPMARSVARLLWEKAWDFISRAFTVIFVASLAIWFLQTFDFGFKMVENSEQSMLSAIAGWIAPVFRPLGLDDWRVVTSFISGFLTKESVVSTMEMLGVAQTLTLPMAVSMLVFCLLYTPCVAAIAAVRRELGTKWALITIVFQCSVAWVVAFLAYRIALLI